ncbi:hypothetical protein CHLNCDRAFT_144119 [Chlorella variabilis]|uniref:Uncharacterized protein n=1 Tax=Chlorella variabilis TaxID=554065 RepID=E1ZBY4_CHLVA|nr:hypothetical protein CHLNCDRAFT_144119 [Chlorella variabilis]EFN56717.1 hypothetical protein CHLNCDRAFT_144119 [Chlorella variabilis]|eukprot:XP_005848819.1 hypothetical protein CHLNCDRAFT_144119 [Chlorella variabilis]
MESGQAADLAIFVCCCALLLGYNIFYFSVASFTFFKRRYIILYAVNRQSRASWVQHLSKDSKEGINAVQTIRNQVLAVSILAATTAPLAAQLINVITDTAKLQQVADFSKSDPISSVALFSPQIKLGIALGILLLAVMAYAQSVRLSVHIGERVCRLRRLPLGYTIRVVASDPTGYTGLSHLSVTLMRRSSLYFAIGLRLFFVFGPLVLWIIGPTTLLVATLLDVAAQFLFDVVPAAACEPEPGEDDKAEAAADASAAAKADAAAVAEHQ